MTGSSPQPTTSAITNQLQTGTRQPWSPEIQPLEDLTQNAQNWMNSQFNNPTVWTGPRVADFDPSQIQGQNTLLGVANAQAGANYPQAGLDWSQNLSKEGGSTPGLQNVLYK